MEPETQEEVKVVMEAEEPRVVDLNQATVEELATLPGVGPTLAQRILAHRQAQGPFRSPEDIVAVPGVGPELYGRLADRLAITLNDGTVMRGAPLEEGAEMVSLPAEEPLPQEEPAPEAEALPLEEEPSPAAVGPPPGEVSPEEAPAPPPSEPAAPALPVPPAPVPAAPRGRGLLWLLSALVGGVLGMIFTLLVLSGINGSLDIGNSRAVLEVENRMEGLAAEMNSLQGEVDGLRQRLDVLGGLTARMDRADSALEDLREETAALGEQAEALEDEMEAVSEDLAAVQTQSQRVGAFFERLQILLSELFGETEATPTPTAPPATPTPSSQ